MLANNSSRLFLGSATASLLLISVVGAQATTTGTPRQGQNVIRATSAPRYSTLHLASSELTPGIDEGTGGGVVLAPAFSNIDSAAFFTPLSIGAEYLDWGVVTDDTGSDLVGSLTFGYGTTTLDQSIGGPGASVTLRFYDGAQGFCADTGLAPTAELIFTGLPGVTTSSGGVAINIINVDLSGGFEFTHAGAGNAFGFSLVDTNDPQTGPLLCFAGDGLGGPDANGQLDVFDVYETDVQSGVCIGSFFFGGPPSDFSSWYLEFNSVDTANSTQASATKRNTTNPDVYSAAGGPVIGGTYQATITSSFGGGFVAIGVSSEADTFPTAFGDLLLGQSDLSFAGPFPYVNGVANISFSVRTDLSQVGQFMATQSIELGGGHPELHNAVDLVFGF